jgi:hypothetical protein
MIMMIESKSLILYLHAPSPSEGSPRRESKMRMITQMMTMGQEEIRSSGRDSMSKRSKRCYTMMMKTRGVRVRRSTQKMR